MLTPTAAQADPKWNPSTPVVVHGNLGEASDVSAISFRIHPTDATLQGLAEGEASPPIVERTSPEFRVTKDGYDATLDPAVVPADYMTSEGVVQLDVLLETPTGPYISTTSVRAVTVPTGGTATYKAGRGTVKVAWADPIASPGWAGQQGKASLLGKRSPAAARTDVTEPEYDSDGVITYEPTPLPAGAAPSGCTDIPGSKDTRSTTIGTTYPVSGDVAKMVVSSSAGARYGIATSLKDPSGNWGSYKASDDKFTSTGWGFAWDASSRARSYRKGVEYQLFTTTCVQYCDHCYRQWRPIGETGGTGSNYGITRPDWTNCATQDKGGWWRDRSDGSAYTYGGAVKFAGVIGIDLSIKRNYTTNQKLYYNFAAAGRRLCGNNDWPSTAGKIMEKS